MGLSVIAVHTHFCGSKILNVIEQKKITKDRGIEMILREIPSGTVKIGKGGYYCEDQKNWPDITNYINRMEAFDENRHF